MYCKKCGKETNNSNNICNNCQVENQNQKSNKVLSIVGLVSAIIIPPVGFILSLIGLITGKKYEKNYKKLNIIGIISSIVITILQIVLSVFLILLIINKASEPLVGEWKCTDNSYSSYLTNRYIEFNLKDNKTFIWSPYTNSQSNYVTGKYKVNKLESTNGNKKYDVTLNVKDTKVNGLDSNLKSNKVDLRIYKYKDRDTITVYFKSTYKTYYCTKVN